MYHYIRTNPLAGDRVGFNLSVTPADFARQMSYLQRIGAHSVSMGDVMDAVGGKASLPARSVVLTFDDGYADFATAAEPIMAWHGFRGTTYVCPGLLGKPNYMTAAQVQRIASLGSVIGAHTVHHVDLPKMSPGVAWAEIAGSRDQLRALTSQPVTDFAYPFGHFNSTAIAMVERAGFRNATTTMPGAVQSDLQRFLLPRVRVSGGESLATFAASVNLEAVPPGEPTPAPTPLPAPATAVETAILSNASRLAPASPVPAAPPRDEDRIPPGPAGLQHGDGLPLRLS
jgi:peptidoglycan/xylan/chitin deacetylase (PgdA/CDA1 family)